MVEGREADTAEVLVITEPTDTWRQPGGRMGVGYRLPVGNSVAKNAKWLGLNVFGAFAKVQRLNLIHFQLVVSHK